jgi:hypothetical protein
MSEHTPPRARRRLVAGLVGVAVGAGSLSPALAAPPAVAPPAFVLDTVSGHLPGEGPALRASAVSADGSLVLYGAQLDGAPAPSLLLRDRTAGTTVLVDHTPTGVPADAGADDAALSADGSVVAFVSRAGDLDGGEPDGGTPVVHLTDTAGGTVRPVPLPTGLGGQVSEVELSADGSVLAVLLSPDFSGDPVSRLLVLDLADGTVRVDEPLPAAGVTGLELSGDGTRTALVTETADGLRLQVRGSDGAVVAEADDWGASTVALDQDGSTVAYHSAADELVVRDVDGGTRAVVPLPDDVYPMTPSLSADGAHVVVSGARWDEGALPSQVLHAPTGGGEAVVVAGGGEEGDPAGTAAASPALSADGSTTTLWLDGRVVAASAQAAGEVDTEAPVWPAGAALTATPLDAGAVRLSWPPAADPGLRGYELTVDGAPLADVGTGRTSYDAPVPDPGVPSTYGVRAVDSAGNRSTELTATARGLAALEVEQVAPGSLQLTFPAVDDPAATALRVLRAPGGQPSSRPEVDPAALEVVAELPAGATSWQDDGLPQLTWFGYRVDAVLADGSSHPMTGTAVQHTTAPTGAPLQVSAVTSTGALLSWPAADPSLPLDGYRVERRQTAPRSTPWAAAGTTAATTSTQTGLEPGSTYAWRVAATTTGGWGELAWTVEATAQLQRQGVEDLRVDVERGDDDSALVLGSEVVVSARDETGLTGTVVVSTGTDGGGRSVTLPMSEVEPGRYATGPYVLDGTVLDRVGRVEVQLTDGVRTDRGTLLDLGVVGGRLDLAATGTADLDGAVLRVVGERASIEVPWAGDTSLDLRGGRYQVSLVAPDGDVLATRAVTLPAAGTGAVELEAVRHTTLAVALSAAAGPVQPGSVTVTTTDGELLAAQSFPGGAASVLLPGLPTGGEVVVRARLADQGARTTQPSAPAALAGGRVDVALRQEPLPVADVAVRATGLGAPLPSATVVVTQVVDGRTFTTTRTVPAGVGTVPALAGPATVRVEAPFHVTTTETVVLPGSVTVDLARTPTYRIRPQLLTTNSGGEQVSQPLDWITGSHFRATLSVAGRGVQLAPEVAWAGAAGDQVRLCADGAEAGLSATCTTVVLGEQRDVDVRVELVQAGTLTARLLGPAGLPVEAWSADVVRLDGVRTVWQGTQRGTGADVQVALPATGSYRVTWRSGAAVAVSTAQVTGSDPVALGNVRLGTGSAPAAGTVLQVLPDPVLPGATAVLRVVVPAETATDRASLRVLLPAGTSHVPGSAVVDGQPVASVADGGTVTVPLAGRAATTVRVPVEVAADAVQGEQGATVVVVRASGGDQELGVARFEVRGLQLSGPATVATGSFPLSGEAPAGAPVEIRDAAGRVLGSATAGPGGRFTAPVELYAPAPGADYELLARAVVDGRESLSRPHTVRYDPSWVEPELVTVDSVGGTGPRSVSFDPRQGVPSMTMVFVPSQQLRVTARFADASRVTGFSAAVGSLWAAGTCDAVQCTALLPRGDAADVGDIRYDYDVLAQPRATWLDVPVSGMDAARNQLPVLWRQAVVTARSGGGATRLATVQLQDGLSVDTTVAVTMVPDDRRGPADAGFRASSGLPFQDVSVSATPTSEGVTVSMAAAVPESFLTAVPGARTALPPAEKVLPYVQILMQFKAVESMRNDLAGLLMGTEQSEVLDELEAHVREKILPCAPDQAREQLFQINYSRASVGYYRLSNMAMGALGLLGAEFAAAFEGAGVVLSPVFQAGVESVVGDGFEVLANHFIDEEMATITAEVRGQVLCNPAMKTLPLFWKPPAGRPHWIYDPSGTVYEALASQPLAGVTATVYSGASADGPWTVWDAAAYGQTNPQPTTATGYYGWDVPQGWWRVEYSAPGYRTQTSAPMQVLPEHYGVDVDLHRLTAPALSTASFTAAGGLAVEFDQWMSVDSVRAGLSLRLGSTAVAGTLAAVGAQRAPDGVLLARSFTFTPTTPLPSQAAVRLVVAGATVDHGDVALGADATRDLRAPARPDAPVACGMLTLAATPTSRVAPSGVVTATVTAPAGAPVQLRGITTYSVVEWLRALLTGQGAGARPSVVLAEGRADAQGRVQLTFRATRDALVFAQQTGCTSTSRLVVVDVK